MKQYTFGLAGHIDHGKTSLVKALTGYNTDNLIDEISRGMTIDIGFAFLSNKITLIDVPGHEKFIKNMVAGVNNVDAVIFLVGADDGIMPQTIEHFEILKLLNIQRGIIVINKIDLVDNDWIELVIDDINKLVENSFLHNADILKVSSINGTGIEKLRNKIINLSLDIDNRNDRGIFRMPIDRAFSIKGFGTVVTGTISSGFKENNNEICLLPQNIHVKIRKLQSHSEYVDRVSFGDRAAINISNIDSNIINRGNQLVEKNHFIPVDNFIAIIKLVESAQNGIKHFQRVRLLCGTQELFGRIYLVNEKNIFPGNSHKVFIKCEEPALLAIEDYFILRNYSPLFTISGGKVLELNISDKWKNIKEYIKLLNSDLESNILPILEKKKNAPYIESDFIKKINYSKNQIMKMKNVINHVELYIDKFFVTKSQVSFAKTDICELIKKFHKKNPYALGINKATISQKLKFNIEFLSSLLLELENEKILKSNNNFWSEFQFEINLDNQKKNQLDNIVKILVFFEQTNLIPLIYSLF
mgnify:CR=1 FL=1